jgi:hypothetical protein
VTRTDNGTNALGKVQTFRPINHLICHVSTPMFHHCLGSQKHLCRIIGCIEKQPNSRAKALTCWWTSIVMTR